MKNTSGRSAGTSEKARRAVEFTLAGWLVVTLVNQHPHRVFDRLRSYDKVGLLIPNWRFFAPKPARHDFHLLYRTLSTADQQSPWKAASTIAARKWSQVVWFPGRRQEKAVFDICSELASAVGNPNIKITETPAYRLLRRFVLRRIEEADEDWPEVRGYQFLITQYSGHDHSEEPTYVFISSFVPVDDGGEDGRPRAGSAGLETVA
ncbi:hypothetical protein [Streptomyces abyssalis]|uniref:hypothetical protein n=1 Tax=Streptomyces abyssalis TaxID=933944 RepID=UPI00085C8C66|nr:hypothetical protein [Streptomyces abyssalis]